MAITREDLYEQVWASPMLEVAKSHGVSANYLARVCAALNVPWPPRGYWAKVAAGRRPTKPTLPAARPGDQEAWEKGRGLDVPLTRNVREVAEQRTGGETSVGQPLRHALIRGMREHFNVDRLTDNGYVRPRKRLLVDIVVSKALISAALDVANDLFLALERHGYRVCLQPGQNYSTRLPVELDGRKYDHYYHREPWRPDRQTVVFINDVVFGLTLFESSAAVEVQYVDGDYVPVKQLSDTQLRWVQRHHSWTSTKYLPTGRLTLRAYAAHSGVAWRQEWSEKAPGDMVHRFNTIRRELEQAAPEVHRLIEAARVKAEGERRKWEEQQRQWRREERARRREEALKTSHADLLSRVERWALARRIEEFLLDVASRARDLDDSAKELVLSRLDVGRRLLGGIDALAHFAEWRTPVELFKASSREPRDDEDLLE